MGIIHLLVALYPKKWRASFGEDFSALLEDTRLTPPVILDVILSAVTIRIRGHRRLMIVLTLSAWLVYMECISARFHLTDNVLWAPTTPARALALAATVGPWMVLAAVAATRAFGRRYEQR
jgi:hypothetical protein